MVGLLQWNTQLHYPPHCSPPYPAVDCDADNVDDDGVAAVAVDVAVAAVVVFSEALVVNSDYTV